MNLKDLWLSALHHLSGDLKRAQLITWFKNTAVLSLEKGTARIGLPLPFFLGWHSTHFSAQTLAALQQLDPGIKHLAYEVDLSLADGDSRVVDLLKHFPKENEVRKLPKRNEQKSRGGIVSKQLNPRYTLENFITSPENRLAHAACQNVSKYPGQNYNPLFIYGGVGLGKTHLLQGVANEMTRNNPDAFVVYMTAENFMNEMIKSIQNKNMESFRQKYRKVDAFIIDDIQFLANKERSQEEFFHTFNALYDLGSQLILSSDRPPHELTLLDDRLVSRFESGMIVDVRMPDYETRLAILQSKLQDAQVFVNQEVLEFVAGNVDHSVRALEGVLKQAIAKYELEQAAPTVKSVSEMMKQSHREIGELKLSIKSASLQRKSVRVAITLDQLIESVADYYTVTKSDVLGASRLRENILPRQIIMYLANIKLRMPLAKIGRAFGNRNHTTVMHSVNRIKKELFNNRQLLRDINAIVQEVGIS